MAAEKSKYRKHVRLGHFLFIFALLCMKIGLRVWAVYAWPRIKKACNPYISPPRGGTTSDLVLTRFGFFGKIGELRNAITNAKFEIKRFKIVTLVRVRG